MDENRHPARAHNHLADAKRAIGAARFARTPAEQLAALQEAERLTALARADLVGVPANDNEAGR